jgi:hypothetical protein
MRRAEHLVGSKLTLQRIYIGRGVVLNVRLRPVSLGLLSIRWSLLSGTDDSRQDKEHYRAKIEKYLEVLLQHAFGLGRVIGEFGVCCCGDDIGHDVSPFS